MALWIIGALFLLTKGADWLVNQAVALSTRSGIPKVVIGAPIVSLGTTAPEAAVSVLAAVQGNPGLALGNAVGSVICDTGLILGLAALIAPLKLDRRIVNRQGWIQFGAGILLVAACIPWSDPGAAFRTGGRLPQWAGFVFLGLLAAYLYASVKWTRQAGTVLPEELRSDVGKSIAVILVKLVAALVIVVVSARLLIPAVKEAALRLDVPQSVIAATLVAFGTSLPELVTALTAAVKRHGELAIGNVVGADILNVLFVSGAAAAVTGGGLVATTHFFRLLFPAMLGVLFIFRAGIFLSGDHMRRGFGIVLLAVYGLVTVLSYVFPE
ncbi:MAG: sodium:calcium antiporter [Candidatus Eisenbacteria bacterium]|nr:sodium:calcium antiporter [Candidatus Eisenbacteria bacterium]